jgi:hypothetical protein
MDKEVVREMALMIASKIEASGPVKGEWAPWNLAEQVNTLIDEAARAIGEEMRPLLPAKFVQSARMGLAVARYLDVGIAAGQVASLLEPREAKKQPA